MSCFQRWASHTYIVLLLCPHKDILDQSNHNLEGPPIGKAHYIHLLSASPTMELALVTAEEQTRGRERQTQTLRLLHGREEGKQEEEEGKQSETPTLVRVEQEEEEEGKQS